MGVYHMSSVKGSMRGITMDGSHIRLTRDITTKDIITRNVGHCEEPLVMSMVTMPFVKSINNGDVLGNSILYSEKEKVSPTS